MWDDNHIGWLKQVIFAEPPLTMSPMPEITGDEEPAASEIEPEQEAAVQAIEEQPVIVADQQNNKDDDEQSRY